MAGTITHQWTGTVLTITSDSGTSSCDLKGAKGDDGARGAQGAPGSSVAEDSQMLGGVAAAQYAKKNGVPAHNLLDNSDFRNPVNQRGQSSYNGITYTIDRWRSWDSNNITTVNDGNISVSVHIVQNIPKNRFKNGSTYTIALCALDGTIYVNSGVYTPDAEDFGDWTHTWVEITDSGDVAIYIRNGTYVWAALYEGSYDASTLPPYVPKGYAAELAECQRYFIRVSNSAAYGIISGTGCVVKVPLPMTMRKDIVPTVTLDSAAWAYTHEGYVGLTFIGTTYSTNTASLHFTLETETSARCCVVPDLSFNISADL